MKYNNLRNKRCLFYNEEKDNCKCLKEIECKGCKFFKAKDDIIEIKRQAAFKRGVIINVKQPKY